MREAEQSIPCVVLSFKTAREVGQTVEVTLTASIKDEDVWQAVLKQLTEGVKIYTSDDFKTEILHVLREENARLSAEIVRKNQEIYYLRSNMMQLQSMLSEVQG